MNTSSALDPQSPQAHVIGGVGVISTIIFVLIFIIVTGAIVYALTFLPLLSAVGLAGAYGFYAAAAVISLTFVWAAVRETKGKTLEQMKDTTDLNQSLASLKRMQA
jgi:membrane protein implicated in regulation of membrane protease activity